MTRAPINNRQGRCEEPAEEGMECLICRGNGTLETGEMECGPAGIGFETMDCPRCGGSGCVALDLNEDIDDD